MSFRLPILLTAGNVHRTVAAVLEEAGARNVAFKITEGVGTIDVAVAGATMELCKVVRDRLLSIVNQGVELTVAPR